MVLLSGCGGVHNTPTQPGGGGASNKTDKHVELQNLSSLLDTIRAIKKYKMKNAGDVAHTNDKILRNYHQTLREGHNKTFVTSRMLRSADW
jgi:hypothetical protein